MKINGIVAYFMAISLISISRTMALEVTEMAGAPQPVKFTVQNTLTQQMAVEQAAEIAGLPPVKGSISVTVQLVDDPGLVDPLPAAELDSDGHRRAATTPENVAAVYDRHMYSGTDAGGELVFVSATVYDHSRTLLKCHLGGSDQKEISVWSNLDFNHFGGLCSLQITMPGGEIRDFGLVMGLGNEDSRQGSAGREAAGSLKIPPLPDMATGGPAFRLIEGDSGDANAVGLVQAMHDLYQLEGAQMAADYDAKTHAEEARKAYLLEHPAVPKDVTIQFWKRESPTVTATAELNSDGHRPAATTPGNSNEGVK